MTLVVRDDADVLDAHLAFHLLAGVDLILAFDEGSSERSAEILEAHAREGFVIQQPRESGSETDAADRMMRHAVDHGADWVIASRPDEFWWPRGESLGDALVAVPERYTIVQALVRTFVPRPEGPSFFAERMVVRRVPGAAAGDHAELLESALRPIVRAGASRPRVPLRAWYPVEVLSLPARSVDAESVVDDEAVAEGLADGSLVLDERLKDVLRELRRPPGGTDPGGRQFLLPSEAPEHRIFGVPDIVDDAAYAVDCAAVGEVDLARLDRHIRELEERIAWLEDRFWPRVQRTLSRFVHRSGT